MNCDFNLLIAEQNPVFSEQVKKHLHQLGLACQTEVVNQTKDIIRWLKKAQPGLLMLDGEIWEINFPELWPYIQTYQVPFVVVTNHLQRNRTDFSPYFIDHLTLPLAPDKLHQAMVKAGLFIDWKNKAKPFLTTELHELNPEIPSKLSIHSQHETEFIEIQHIVRLEAEGCYTHLFLNNKRKITVSKTLREYESILLNKKFVRIHNSHIINMNHILKFIKKDGFMVLMTDGNYIPISVRRKDLFENKLRLVAI